MRELLHFRNEDLPHRYYLASGNHSQVTGDKCCHRAAPCGRCRLNPLAMGGRHRAEDVLRECLPWRQDGDAGLPDTCEKGDRDRAPRIQARGPNS